MSDLDDFLTWVKTALYEAESALHNGDARPRRAIWSRNEPVSVLGAWRDAQGQQEIDELFESLAASFSNCTSYRFELQAAGASFGRHRCTAVKTADGRSATGMPTP